MTTAASLAPPARRSYLQFSLRWLLILVTLGAIALGLYRSQWEKVEVINIDIDTPEKVRVTTYHFGWNAKRIKHGPEREFELEVARGHESLFVEGAMAREREYCDERVISQTKYTPPGSTNVEVLHENANGPLTLKDANIKGVWLLKRDLDGETISQRVNWKNAQRHGKTTWKIDGRVVQTAEFDQGRVIRWNDKPVAEELRRWAQHRVPDAELRRILFVPLQEPIDYGHASVGDLGYVWIPTQPGPPFLMHFGFRAQDSKAPAPWQPRFQDRLFAEVSLECALNNWSTLDFRYGCVCSVPLSSARELWTDPTGSDQVRFEEGTTAEVAWQQLATTDTQLHQQPAARLRDLFEGTDIQVNTKAVDVFDNQPSLAMPVGALPYYPRPRRDLFGHILFVYGYVCEQRGETLVIRKPMVR
jgi:hypothetical protein